MEGAMKYIVLRDKIVVATDEEAIASEVKYLREWSKSFNFSNRYACEANDRFYSPGQWVVAAHWDDQDICSDAEKIDGPFDSEVEAEAAAARLNALAEVECHKRVLEGVLVLPDTIVPLSLGPVKVGHDWRVRLVTVFLRDSCYAEYLPGLEPPDHGFKVEWRAYDSNDLDMRPKEVATQVQKFFPEKGKNR
jgi:hypothetical protein